MAQNQRCGKGFGWIVSILDTSLSKKLKIQYFYFFPRKYLGVM